ncbi:MAG: hypothetical protein EXR99_01170 [Gemmataceae bacterium]|nr:hypothetical protein [Gemmataceae bacterium]
MGGKYSAWILSLYFLAIPSMARAEPPSWLPTYHVQMQFNAEVNQVNVVEKARWVNQTGQPVTQVQFNAHSHYVLPSTEIGKMAKTMELLRLNPSEALGVAEPVLNIEKIHLLDDAGLGQEKVKFHFSGPTNTTLVVRLPQPVPDGKAVHLELVFSMKLPEKQGRWGRWKEVTFLANWLPVFAFHQKAWKENDPEEGWRPTPFIPWHQPFHNEAGNYFVKATLPGNQVIASSGQQLDQKELPQGWKEVSMEALGVRDFGFVCSKRFQRLTTEVSLPGRDKPLKIHVNAFKEHEHYAKEITRMVADAMVAYSQWFGPYPYPEFTIAESYFGWNGNECGAMVLIDERVFDMPKLASQYTEYLISHEVCHQWWYNLVGTDGYRETWMDEALATYFSHRLLNLRRGKNNEFLSFPGPFRWLPNIRRDDYRMVGFYGTLGRGEHKAILQPMENFGHVVNLFSMCYDKGAKVVELIEGRLGSQGFMDFMKGVFQKYQYKILHTEDFQKELEEFTGKPWNDFFHHWLRTPGLVDWKIESVESEETSPAAFPGLFQTLGLSETKKHKTVITLKQVGDFSEPTYLGFSFGNREDYPVRIPILPRAGVYELDDPPAKIESLGGETVRVTVELPEEPSQISIDPDQVIVDKNPANNHWRHKARIRFTPLYTFLDETDVTNAYDRWNYIFGPWLYSAGYDDAWYTRATMGGFRLGAYRTQQFSGGLFAAYRTDYRDFVVGADGLFTHWPSSPFQFGFNAEHRLYTFYEGNNNVSRATLFGRYVFLENASLYLLPTHFMDLFASYRDNFLPDPVLTVPGAERFRNITTGGLHYRINYLTPYWDPEGGFQFDAVYEAGQALLEEMQTTQKVWAEFSTVRYLPDPGQLRKELANSHPFLRGVSNWLDNTRLAVRAFGGSSVPSRGQFFSMGSGELFRAFDLAQMQGSTTWVGSVELRFPLIRHSGYGFADRLFSLENTYLAVFYDVGNTYVSGQALGPVAQGIGAGLRWDVSFLSFVERVMIRVDAAKALNYDTGAQFWFGIQQPF